MQLEKSLIWPTGLKNGKDGTAENFHFTSVVVILKAIFFFFFCKGGKMWNIVENSQSANYFERVKHVTVSDWLPNTMTCSITKLRL